MEGKVFECITCGEKFGENPSFGALSDHWKTHHPDPPSGTEQERYEKHSEQLKFIFQRLIQKNDENNGAAVESVSNGRDSASEIHRRVVACLTSSKSLSNASDFASNSNTTTRNNNSEPSSDVTSVIKPSTFLQCRKCGLILSSFTAVIDHYESHKSEEAQIQTASNTISETLITSKNVMTKNPKPLENDPTSSNQTIQAATATIEVTPMKALQPSLQQLSSCTDKRQEISNLSTVAMQESMFQNVRQLDTPPQDENVLGRSFAEQCDLATENHDDQTDGTSILSTIAIQEPLSRNVIQPDTPQEEHANEFGRTLAEQCSLGTESHDDQTDQTSILSTIAIQEPLSRNVVQPDTPQEEHANEFGRSFAEQCSLPMENHVHQADEASNLSTIAIQESLSRNVIQLDAPQEENANELGRSFAEQCDLASESHDDQTDETSILSTIAIQEPLSRNVVQPDTPQEEHANELGRSFAEQCDLAAESHDDQTDETSILNTKAMKESLSQNVIQLDTPQEEHADQLGMTFAGQCSLATENRDDRIDETSILNTCPNPVGQIDKRMDIGEPENINSALEKDTTPKQANATQMEMSDVIIISDGEEDPPIPIPLAYTEEEMLAAINASSAIRQSGRSNNPESNETENVAAESHSSEISMSESTTDRPTTSSPRNQPGRSNNPELNKTQNVAEESHPSEISMSENTTVRPTISTPRNQPVGLYFSRNAFDMLTAALSSAIDSSDIAEETSNALPIYIGSPTDSQTPEVAVEVLADSLSEKIAASEGAKGGGNAAETRRNIVTIASLADGSAEEHVKRSVNVTVDTEATDTAPESIMRTVASPTSYSNKKIVAMETETTDTASESIMRTSLGNPKPGHQSTIPTSKHNTKIHKNRKKSKENQQKTNKPPPGKGKRGRPRRTIPSLFESSSSDESGAERTGRLPNAAKPLVKNIPIGNTAKKLSQNAAWVDDLIWNAVVDDGIVGPPPSDIARSESTSTSDYSDISDSSVEDTAQKPVTFEDADFSNTPQEPPTFEDASNPAQEPQTFEHASNTAQEPQTFENANFSNPAQEPQNAVNERTVSSQVGIGSIIKARVRLEIANSDEDTDNELLLQDKIMDTTLRPLNRPPKLSHRKISIESASGTPSVESPRTGPQATTSNHSPTTPLTQQTQTCIPVKKKASARKSIRGLSTMKMISHTLMPKCHKCGKPVSSDQKELYKHWESDCGRGQL